MADQCTSREIKKIYFTTTYRMQQRTTHTPSHTRRMNDPHQHLRRVEADFGLFIFYFILNVFCFF